MRCIMEIVLPLQVLDIDVENVEYRLIGTEGNNSVLWIKADGEPAGEDFRLEIETDKEMKRITKITKGARIETTEHVITSYSIHYTKLYDYLLFHQYNKYKAVFLSVPPLT